MKQDINNRKVITASVFPIHGEETTIYSILNWKDSFQPIQVGELKYHIFFDQLKKTLIINYKAEMEYLFEGLTTEVAEVLVDVSSLRPIKINCKFENKSQTIHLTGIYKKNKVVINYTEDGIKDKWVERIPYYVLDNYELPIALRALDYNKLELDTFSLVNPLTLSLAEVECSLSDKEIITTQIGNFDCFRVRLQVFDPLPFTQYHLYSVNPPHTLVKLIKGPLIFELKKIE